MILQHCIRYIHYLAVHLEGWCYTQVLSYHYFLATLLSAPLVWDTDMWGGQGHLLSVKGHVIIIHCYCGIYWSLVAATFL